jgi:hypothetical protein
MDSKRSRNLNNGDRVIEDVKKFIKVASLINQGESRK